VAAGMVIVLVLAGFFVYDRVGRHLNNTINDGLVSQSGDLSAFVSGSTHLHGRLTRHPDEGFSQILGPDGQVIASTLPLSVGSTLPAQDVQLAAEQRLIDDVPSVPAVHAPP